MTSASSNWQRKTIHLRSLIAFAALLLPFSPPASAREIRVATYNIENGTGEIGSAKYTAIHAVLQRIDADVICFQELRSATFGAWSNLAATLGYPYSAIGGNGPFSGSLYNGFFSRFPILSTHDVQSPPGAVELTRFPFRAVVDVPDAQRPLVLWTMHHKSSAGSIDKFRRAIEALRIVQNIDAYLAENPSHLDYVLTGDMNDDVRDYQTPASFASQPSGAPGGYVLGSDVAFPVAYATFPSDRYAGAGAGLQRLPAYWENSSTPITRVGSGRQLDYIFLSPALFDSPLGAPRSEVYYSDADAGGGLPKLGSPLPVGTSAAASDHLPIFVDLQLADFSCLLPTAAFLSSGEAGGPFDPDFMTYVLTETNAFSTSWIFEPDVDWLSLSHDSAALDPYAPLEIDVFLNENAAALPPGTHTGSVSFWNETTDLLESRDVVLTVRDHLAVFPSNGFTAAGIVGGPFSPASASFTVTNKSALAISFTASASNNWLSVSPSSWLLQPGESIAVEASLNANALALPIAAYTDTLVISNLLTGLVELRPVSLTVSGALCNAVDLCSHPWTTGGDLPWAYQSLITADGADAAQSGSIAPSQQSWIETTVTGPLRVSFQWRVSSRTNSHYFRFLVNGASQAAISGETAWTPRVHDIAVGVHTLRWSYATATTAPVGSNAAWLDQVVLHHLTASPSASWSASGLPGGPFAPDSRTNTLLNSGPDPIAWTATSSVPWISIDPANGELAPGDSIAAVFSLNTNANLLYAGSHSGSVVFSNLLTGDSFARAAFLSVRDVLVITPDYSWHTGFVGGPFAPPEQVYSLSNSGPETVAWSVASNANWVAADPSSGSIAPGTASQVVARLNAHANALPAGWSSTTLVFSNATTGLAQSRAVYVESRDSLSVAAPGWSPSGPVGGPFAPPSAAYVLTNGSSTAQSWTASASAPWLSLDPSGGSLGGTSATAVAVSLNAAAETLPIGVHSASIVFSNFTSGGALTQSVFLAAGVVFCDALEACALPWSFGGNAPWIYQTDVSTDGVDAAASGPITHSQESWMQTSVAGPGSLSFWWKVSSETSYDYLEFYIDGIRTNRISGAVDWQLQSFALPSGSHTLRWRYTKDSSVNSGSDRAWVDLLAWTPAATLMGVPLAWYERFGLAPALDESWDDLDWLPAASGAPNWLQHVAGLDPTRPDDLFQILDIHQIAGEPTVLQWWGGTNGPANPYVIETTLDLDHGPWEPIGSSARTSGVNAWTNPAPADLMRFYRIQALPDPAP